MRRSLKITIQTISFILVAFATNATSRKVLFIGNSFTYTNNMPSILQALATSMGDTLVYDQNTPGGYTLQLHSTDATTISKIFSQQWDIVVIQEQSQLPAFPPAQVDTTTFRYAHILDSMVHANDTCTQTMFLMTWGYRDGDTSNCAFYPPICTYGGMQQSLRDSYLQMTHDNKAIVAPVGAAWKVVRDSFTAINLYMADLIHPGMPGSYLEASVLYASIFHKNPYPSAYLSGLPATDAQTLRRIAAKVTLDSLNQWQQYGHYPFADFSFVVSGSSLTTTNKSQNANSYFWNFGDSNTTTGASPGHSYTHSGNYLLSLTVSTNCFSETRMDSIQIGSAGIGAVAQNENSISIVNEGKGNITFRINEMLAGSKMEVCDMSGRRIRTYSVQSATSIKDHFSSGVYAYRIIGGSGGSSQFMGTFMVY